MPNNHGFRIPNEQGMAQQAQREMQAKVKDKPLKKSFGIELNEEEIYLLKRTFSCQSDVDLRYALQEAITRIIKGGMSENNGIS